MKDRVERIYKTWCGYRLIRQKKVGDDYYTQYWTGDDRDFRNLLGRTYFNQDDATDQLIKSRILERKKSKMIKEEKEETFSDYFNY